jgi:hypothetical protein
MAETDSQRRWGLPNGKGPVHEERPGSAWGQAWCGARPQFRHVNRNDEAVTCARCLKGIERGRPFARGAR